MGKDWTRLGKAIKTQREARGLTQQQLADEAGVSLSTIQNFESGVDRTRIPTTLPRVEAALRWEKKSSQAILEGGEPTPLPIEETDPSSIEPAASDLPLRIVEELRQGQLIDTTVMDLTPLGSSARMIVVVKGKPDASPEQIRQDLLAWAKAQRTLQDLGNGDDEDEPPVAHEA